MGYGTWTIFVISCISITPLPSTSYIRNAHFSFSSGVPLDVTSIAKRNSCNKGRRYPASVTASWARASIETFISPPQQDLPLARDKNSNASSPKKSLLWRNLLQQPIRSWERSKKPSTFADIRPRLRQEQIEAPPPTRSMEFSIFRRCVIDRQLRRKCGWYHARNYGSLLRVVTRVTARL